MAAPDDLLALNQALSQADRARDAPAPDRVEIDGRSFADLLAFAAEYGRLITFYDLANTPDGDWSAFFASDPTVQLALRVSLATEEIERTFDVTLGRLAQTPDADARRRHTAAAVAVLRKLAHIHSGGESGDGDFDRTLATLARGARGDLLAAPARELRAHLGKMAPEEAVRGKDGDWIDRFVDQLDRLGDALLTALAQDRDATIAAIEQSLGTGDHRPQAALYNAFAVLFGHAQDAINRFPARLQRFYHAEILRQTTRGGTPDHVCVTCAPADGVARADLALGTRFLAGTDADGATIAYALDAPLAVGCASVTGLHTLRVTRSAVAPDLVLPCQVLSGDAALADAAPKISEPFPLFGAEAAGTDGALVSVPAPLGFALASPTLLLAGGKRTVTIALALDDASRDAVWACCERIGTAAGGMPPDEVFRALVTAAFALRYSSVDAWVPLLGGYRVGEIDRGTGRFTLVLSLDADAAPVAALSPDVDPSFLLVPGQDSPMLVADLIQTSVALGDTDRITVYPYAIVSQMRVVQASIAVDVIGLTEFAAASPVGPVDTEQPFAPFGAQPVQYSALEIRAAELFAKPIGHFELDIGWYGLPVTSRGFAGYYQAYVVDAEGKPIPEDQRYHNRSFRAALTVENPGWWTFAPPADAYYLFHTVPDEAGNVPAAERTLAPASQFAAAALPTPPPPYYDMSASAIRLTLTAPDTAFGDLLYPPNVMDASVKLTAAAAACAQQCGSADPDPPSDPLLGPIRAAAERSPDATLEQDVKAAAERAAAQLNDQAIDTIEAAIVATGSDAEALRGSLAAAIGATAPGWGERLRRLWSARPDPATVNAALAAWLDGHRAGLGVEPVDAAAQADALVTAAAKLLAVARSPAGRSPATTRAAVAAQLVDVRGALATVGAGTASDDCVRNCLARAGLPGFPNQPWMPMAATVAISYSATALMPSAPSGMPAEAAYFQLLPQGGVARADWSDGAVSLLAPIDVAGALYIDLSAAAEALDLLLRLAPPPGGWPAETPAVTWEGQSQGGDWADLVVLGDTTDGLRNSGIVKLTPQVPGAVIRAVRASVRADPADFPDLAGLDTNAGIASWVGPGGGATLGTPLPAGTITALVDPDPAIGSVEQPMPSSGGAPALRGSAFDLWSAERLRHKNRGIQAWDYADLLLAAFPTLWQVAVVPARTGSGAEKPGNVWIAPVPGPLAAATANPRMPSNDSQMLADIAAYLADRVGPFVQLWITDPPYLPLRVEAELAFADGDTASGYADRLNAELIAYLSPWPPQGPDVRPKDYYTTRGIAHFIRSRPYVRAILALRVAPPIGAATTGPHYCTSAERHLITGRAQPRSAPNPAPMLVRSATAPVAGDAP